MAGLREKKKQEAYRRILDAGKEAFLKQGYDDTTMERLAEMAGVGVGTVYNHFKTKADVFISIVEDELNLDDFTYRPSAAMLEKGITDIVCQFVTRSFRIFKNISKRLLREILYAAISSMKSDSRLVGRLSSVDYQFIDKLKALLDSLKEKELLDGGFDSDSASMVIYSIVMTQAMLYAFTGEQTYDQFEAAVKTQIAFTLHGKTNGKEENDA